MTFLLNGLVFLLVNTAVALSCWRLSNHLLKDHLSLSLRVVATCILSFAHATVVVLLLGVVFRYLNIWSVSLLSLLVSFAILVFFSLHQQKVLQSSRQTLSILFFGRDYFLYLISALFLLQVILLLLKVIWLPAHIWDVFVYHLPPAVEWYQQGFIPAVLETPVNRINGAPLGMTVLAYWFFIFFRDDFLVELPMLLWALTLVPVSIAVMRQSGVSRAWSLKFAVVIFFLPIVLMQAVTSKDHLGLNVGLIAGLLFLAEFIKTRRYPLLPLAAISFGLVMGYKIAAPIHIVIGIAVFTVLLWCRHRTLLTTGQHRQVLYKTTALSAICLLVVGGYWYLRNLMVYGRLHGAYGTELSEAGMTVGGDSGAVATAFSIFTNLEMLQSNVVEFFPRIFDYQNAYGADLVFISGYGPQFAAFGLLALIVALYAFFNSGLRQQPIFLLSSTVTLLFIALMFVNFNANSYRILSFLPMVLIAYAAVQLNDYQFLEKSWVKRLTNSMIVLCIVWSSVTLLAPQYTNLLRLKEFISLDHSSRISANFTSWFVRPRPSFYRILDAVPVTEPIAHVTYRKSYFAGEVGDDAWTYLYMDRNWQRKIHPLHLPRYFDCQDNRACTIKPALTTFLKQNNVSLLSSCKINQCLNINDPSLIEILPGLYFFLGNR